MKKLFALVFLCGFLLLTACGDSGSDANDSVNPGNAPNPDEQKSALSLPDTVQTLDSLLNEYKCRKSYKCAHVYLVELGNTMECNGDAWVYLSEYQPSVCGYELGDDSGNESEQNSGLEQDPVPESSSAVAQPVSSDSDLPESIVWDYELDCYESGAQLTITNIENSFMQCGDSTEGWTVYDKDHWTLYICKAGNWIEKEAFPCFLD